VDNVISVLMVGFIIKDLHHSTVSFHQFLKNEQGYLQIHLEVFVFVLFSLKSGKTWSFFRYSTEKNILVYIHFFAKLSGSK